MISYKLTLLSASIDFQVSTKLQNGLLPLWNEILELSVPSSSSPVTVSIEQYYSNYQNISNSKKNSFEFGLTSCLEHGFSDEWLHDEVQADPTYLGELGSSESKRCCNIRIRLHISCSFDSALIASRQRGLWPTRFHDRPKSMVAAHADAAGRTSSRDSCRPQATLDDCDLATLCDPGLLLLPKCPLPWRPVRPGAGRTAPDAAEMARLGCAWDVMLPVPGDCDPEALARKAAAV